LGELRGRAAQAQRSMLLVADTIHLANQSKHRCQKIAELEAKIPEQENLQEVMHWALSDPSRFLPQVVADVIIQDEFTHDVIVPWRDELFLSTIRRD
jgi:hypothetical protein